MRRSSRLNKDGGEDSEKKEEQPQLKRGNSKTKGDEAEPPATLTKRNSSKSQVDEPAKVIEEVPKKVSDKNNRLVYGTLGIILILSVVWLGHSALAFLLFIVQVEVFRELMNVRYKEAREKEIPWFRSIHWCIFSISVLYMHFKPISNSFSDSLNPVTDNILAYHAYICLILYAITFICFVLSLKPGLIKYQISQLAWTILTLGIVVVQTKSCFYSIYNGLIWFLLPASLVVCNDSFAYFCGKALGHKIITAEFLSLSPNKTWEGFIGAGIITVIFSFFWGRFLASFPHLICSYETHPNCIPDPVFVPVPTELHATITLFTGYQTANISPIQWHSVYLAFFASLVAPFGGFFASGIKRAYGLKDFDTIIPGHGGLMDRLDCQFIMGLYTLAHYTTFIHYDTLNPVESLLQKAYRLDPQLQLELYHKLMAALASEEMK